MKDLVKQLIKQLLYKSGYTISSGPSQVDFLKSRNVSIVLDVGANIGQYARSLRTRGYEGSIVSFEPVRAAYAILCEQMSGDKYWSGRNYGLGDRRGAENMNVSENSLYSSMMAQTEFATKFDPAAKVSYQESIELFPLDDIFEEFSRKATFLKVDTQGFEEKVLRGAQRALPFLCGIQLELPIEHLYEGTWSLSHAIAELDKYGFVPAQVYPTTFLTNDPCSWTELDCTFRRK